ncbi:MAG TPA: hypothetical protein VHA07_11270 [Devosia sp.]|nr:hypothetical protein [Devosia sp.]
MSETPVHRAQIDAVLSLARDLAMGQPPGFGLKLCLASMALANPWRQVRQISAVH